MAVTYQSTLRDAITFEGVGIHTGASARVRIEPAAANSGVVFVLRGGVRIPALAENVMETARATVLGTSDANVSTVEHLLAALFAMGVDNATIEVEGPEIPVADGSAKTFTEAIAAAGLVAQQEVQPRFIPSAPHFFRDGDRAVIVLPASSFRIRFMADFPPPVNAQFLDAEMSPQYFRNEIAGARTFGYMHEVESLIKRGLAKGGNLENAVVYTEDGPMQPLRWPNEVVRHKVLDLIGDLALLGMYPQCEVIAIKSGHRLHCIATNELRKVYAAGSLLSAKVRQK